MLNSLHRFYAYTSQTKTPVKRDLQPSVKITAFCTNGKTDVFLGAFQPAYRDQATCNKYHFPMWGSLRFGRRTTSYGPINCHFTEHTYFLFFSLTDFIQDLFPSNIYSTYAPNHRYAHILSPDTLLASQFHLTRALSKHYHSNIQRS